MKHVDFNLSYNEIMSEELECIENFLMKQFDLRYGKQAGGWALSPMPELVGAYGTLFKVREIRLDKKCFVKFILKDGDEFEAHNFAYGELSKIIDALPDADEIVKKNAISDLKAITRNYNTIALLQEHPFEFNGQKIIDIEDLGEEGIKFVLDTKHFTLDTTPAISLRDHLNIEILHHSNEYRELMELLSLEENMRFECQNYGDVTFVIDGADMTFDVLSLRRDDKGNLVICGGDIDADVCDNIELTEKDIKREYLVGIINEMKRSKFCDIMDTNNGHDPALVGSINKAWNDKKCHDKFQPIIYAMFMKYIKEFEEKVTDDITDADYDFPMNYLYEILMRLCDDNDLEIILNFVEYDKK